jgi:hypothetical protein
VNERVHFLHLGKTGGSAIKDALEPLASSGSYDVRLHEHSVRLKDLPRGEPFFFAVRDPVSRFVSGFTSRQNQGLPRYDRPWSPSEAVAFRRFATANELGEAIGSDDRELRQAARSAMSDIQHVRNSYWSWFGSERRFRRSSGRILCILFQERLAEDFAELVRLLGLEHLEPRLPDDPVRAHRSATDVDRSLSPPAVANLQRWYEKDYEFVELCRRLDPRPTSVGPPTTVPGG